MLKLTNKEIRKIGRDRYFNKTKWLVYLLMGIVAIGAIVITIGIPTDTTAAKEYSMVNGNNTITVEKEYDTITIDGIEYKLIDKENEYNTAAIVLGALLVVIPLIAAIVIDTKQTQAGIAFAERNIKEDNS